MEEALDIRDQYLGSLPPGKAKMEDGLILGSAYNNPPGPPWS